VTSCCESKYFLSSLLCIVVLSLLFRLFFFVIFVRHFVFFSPRLYIVTVFFRFPFLVLPFLGGRMGTESPDVWPRTAEISFGNTEVTRHDFYDCFEHHDNDSGSIFDAVSRLPGRAFCVFRVGFKTVKDHVDFLEKFTKVESVTIGGNEVKIRVRDRSVNLIRVRIQHFKFNDDLSLLNKRLREYGLVSRIFWDTYQDRLLPKWNGIKTGVVNVDMEIHKGIPSYITFGSYKDPLMVSYAGQMHTCRLCDSPTHVLADCPKQPSRVTTPSTISKGPIGSRNYSSALTHGQGRQTAGRRTQATNPIGIGIGNQIAPTVDAESFPELAQRPTTSTAVVLYKAPEDPVSKPDGPETLSDAVSDAEDTTVVVSSVASKPGRKEKRKETREFRDQQKQSKKKSRTTSSQSLTEEEGQMITDIAQSIELGSPTREDEGSIPGGDVNSFSSISVPPDTDAAGEPSIPTTIDQVDGEMQTTDLAYGLWPVDTSSGSIQPGQRPLDSQEASHVSETQGSLGIPLGTPPTPIAGKTQRTKETGRISKSSNKNQTPKPNFRI
jgi:hypothetical protein